MITVLSLSPAVDKIYVIGDFCAGRMYRVNDYLLSPGGKGINVAKVARRLGAPVEVLGFKAGATGEWLEGCLAEMGAKTFFEKVEGESRTNTNIIDQLNNRETEILEEGPVIDPRAWKSFGGRFEQKVKDSKVLVCSGGIPKGLDSGTYAGLIEKAGTLGVKTVLDAGGEVLQLGIKARPYLIKPNLRELSEFFNTQFSNDSQIVEACRSIIRKGVQVVVTSLGERGAILVTQENVCKAHPYPVDVVNTIGSGDSMVAGISAGINLDMPIEECLRLGCACATSNTEFMEIGVINKKRVEALIKDIKIDIWQEE